MPKASASALLIPALLPLFLLVSLSSGSIAHAERAKERTLAMIKPDGLFGNYSNKIRDVILESGFLILKETMVQLDEGNAKLFYAEHSAKRFFPRLIGYMTRWPFASTHYFGAVEGIYSIQDFFGGKVGHHPEKNVARFISVQQTSFLWESSTNLIGPVIAMVLEKSNAISDWRAVIGPTDPTKAKISHPDSIRAMCGTDIERNCVHGSDSSESAAKEITFFFGEMMMSSVSSSENDLKHDEL